MNIELTFINNSNDSQNTRIVVFTEPPSVPGETATAALSLELAPGETRPATIPLELSIGVQTSALLSLPLTAVKPGRRYDLRADTTALSLVDQGAALVDNVVQVRNALAGQMATITLYCNHKPMQQREGVAAEQCVDFACQPCIWIDASAVSAPGQLGVDTQPVAFSLAGLEAAQALVSDGDAALARTVVLKPLL